MDRQTWLDERRAAVLACYDQEAASYDEHGYPTQVQQEWVARLLARCPAAATILDAPCGTGRYFPIVAAARPSRGSGGPSGSHPGPAPARGQGVAPGPARPSEACQ